MRSWRITLLKCATRCANSGATPYSLHNLEQGAVYEAKEFHLQQALKPLPDKVLYSSIWPRWVA